MTRPGSIVVIIARTADAKPAGESLVDRVLERNPHARIEVIAVDLDFGTAPTNCVAVPLDRFTRMLRRIGAERLYQTLSQSPAGRMLNSIGPVDPGRVAWRSIRRHPNARALMSSADLLIAGDDASIMTAWRARRRGWVTEARFDPRAPADIGADGTP